MGFFDKIKAGLTKTRTAVTERIDDIFSAFSKIDEEFFEELEETLIMADVGVETSLKIVEVLRERIKEKKLKDGEEVRAELKEILTEMMEVGSGELKISTAPSVILVMGVNGAGKTTTIGKIACMLRNNGKKVLLCAGDTFRAAAVEQLKIWAQRADVDIVSQGEGADPASVVFDAISAAKARGTDVIICDTAGRLHNKQNLMKELEKIGRIVDRELPGADKEVLLVLDATTGQNGLIQAQQFRQSVEMSGIVLTKLDGTAKGGIVVAVADTLKVPVKYIGVGEGKDDLLPFNSRDFAAALLDKE